MPISNCVWKYQHTILTAIIFITIGNLIRDCQDELGSFDGAGGPKLAALWKDTQDAVRKHELMDLREAIITAALRNGFLDIAQQVSLLS